MVRRRVQLEVNVDLDEFPGAFDSPEAAKQTVLQILNERIANYHPTVYIPSKSTYPR